MRFEVRDDGAGLPEHNGRVEFSALTARRDRDGLAGLGLTVTRKVAEAHGGRVGAFNRPDGGAVVWFVIPGSDGEATPDS